MKKFLKVVGIVFGGLIGIYIILDITFSIQLHNKIAELKVQGRPMTIAEIVPPPVPDEENAAILYNKAFELMKQKETSEMIETIKNVKSFSDISQWTDKQREEIPKLVNSRDAQDIYQLLEEGSRKPKCNFNPEYEKGFEMLILLPHLSTMRDAVELLCIKTLLEAEAGNLEEAIDTLLIGLRFSNHLKDEQTLISQLVRITCDQLLIECIKGISYSRVIPEGQAALIINELSTHKDVEPFVKCTDMERVGLGTWAFERILRAKPRELKGVIFINYSPHTPLIFIVALLGKPIFKKDFVCYLTFLSGIRDSYNVPYYELAKQVKNKTRGEDIPKYCIFTRAVLPTLNRARENVAKYHADIDVCRTSLALKIYKAKNGAYPKTLSFFSELPIDPFNGKELIYKKSGNGFILYSVGPNMKDDNGIPKAKEYNDPAYNDYDIVWKCNN